MKVLFCIGNGHFPEFHGGVQSSTDHMVREFIDRGIESSVFAALYGRGVLGWRARVFLKLTGKRLFQDSSNGYRVYRGWNPQGLVGDVTTEFKPDVAIVQCRNTVPLGREFAARGIPVVAYLRNVEFDELGGDPRDLKSAKFISNSSFTARVYKEKFGIESTVVPPSIKADQFRTDSTKEFVTFINIDERKGLSLAIQIAKALPRVKFLFVESWILSPSDIQKMRDVMKAVPNITFMKRQSDMRKIYGRTKILLAPSKWEEAWGRVASEAHCSGIPVVGSNRGGLPDAIGEGGVILDYNESVAVWSAAVLKLWSDEDYYESASFRAREYALRPEMNVQYQIQSIIEVASAAAARAD